MIKGRGFEPQIFGKNTVLVFELTTITQQVFPSACGVHDG